MNCRFLPLRLVRELTRESKRPSIVVGDDLAQREWRMSKPPSTHANADPCQVLHRLFRLVTELAGRAVLAPRRRSRRKCKCRQPESRCRIRRGVGEAEEFLCGIGSD